MPLPKGRFEFERHRTDVMNFLFASSESEEDVGGPSSSSETEDNNQEFVNQAAESDSSSQLGRVGDTGAESDTAESVETGAENEENQEMCNPDSTVLGKDKVTVWSLLEPRKTVRTRHCNIVTQKAGPTDTSKDVSGIMECWSLFITDSMIEEITARTNDKVQVERYKWSDLTQVPHTCTTEIKALIGLLYLAGVMRSNRHNLEDLWASDGTGVDIFRNTMSLQRFKFLLRCLRFDDASSRESRKSVDRLAPIRDLFENFKNNCIQHYSVSEFVTIDQKLEGFRGRCSFRQYMPNKPAKYGLKMFAMVDAKTFYTANLEVYVGKQPVGPFEQSNKAEDIVIRLIHPISGTCRNVTVDNWFTSFSLTKVLLDVHRLTLVGTVRKNKRELPPQFVNVRGRSECTSMFGFNPTTTIVSYIPKKHKNVILVSTMHHDAQIDSDTGERNKPHIVTFYNSTKGGVDTADELCETYSVTRKSRRWPLTIFFSMLNIAGINAQIIYKANTDNSDRRRLFLKKLALEMISCHTSQRMSNPRIPRAIRSSLKRCAASTSSNAEPEPELVEPQAKLALTRCEECPRSRDRKTRFRCHSCNKRVCLEHANTVCMTCIDQSTEIDD